MPREEGVPRERVTGIGGFFFAARDPEALARWYAEHLGIDEVPAEYGAPSWRQDAGSTVLAPMPAGSEHLGPAGWVVFALVCLLPLVWCLTVGLAPQTAGRRSAAS